MPNVTDLARAVINGDTITIELIRPADMPAMVRIVWPAQPTGVSPAQFPETAALVARLFAGAATTLAAIKRERSL
jgi:hypothetical protein